MPRQFTLLYFTLALCVCMVSACSSEGEPMVLVFSKTSGFRHESIEAGKAAVQNMGRTHGFRVDLTEDASVFSEINLQQYGAVLFLNTTGDILTAEQQLAFEHYIQAGGGYVGVHSATDTEYDWPWYGELAGARFLDHPSEPSNVQEGRLVVVDTTSWATSMLPNEFTWKDEFYNFRDLSDDITPVLEIDESSYQGGKNPEFHPVSWYHEYDGGRAFYTALGHVKSAYSNRMFLNHLYAGLNYAMGGDEPEALDYAMSLTDENRFTKLVLASNLDEPTELTVLDEDRVLFIERRGAVRLYNTQTGQLRTIATIPVSTTYTTDGDPATSRAEDGLLGLNKDPNFAENQHIYLYYSHPDTSANVLSRFTMAGDELLPDSEKQMLFVATQRQECCHTGGSIAWDGNGNLFLSTGDNTNPFGSDGFSPIDERRGRAEWDAQRSSANTNDLRGKILRITPQPDGTYTIPTGNLFPAGTDKTRPEIYTMGHRNPYRISVDAHTGYVYWGEVGPDAPDAEKSRGPAGHDEIGQARGPGNHGWPHFLGDNKPYRKYDYASQSSGLRWTAKSPLNTSPHNTGLERLPAAEGAFIWYPYGDSPEFPAVGSGGRNAMAGPVFYRDDFTDAERAWPAYYNGKFFAYDWMRGWIMAVTMDEAGDFVSMEQFMPNAEFSSPMDMEFGPNGDLYLLEYGKGWFTQNSDARLSRIEYNEGNRLPQVVATADKAGGTLPLTVNLSAEEATDPENDELSYAWTVTGDNGFEKALAGKNNSVTLERAGTYQARLTVNDGRGGQVSSFVAISAGNAVPQVRLQLPGGNRSFFVPGQPIAYAVEIEDKEDGTIGAGIDEQQVALTMDYLAAGYDQVEIARGHRQADAGALAGQGESLIQENDCASCHAMDKASIGPTYRAISSRYSDEKDVRDRLAGKIVSGGGGAWGDNIMSAHPELPIGQARMMVDYILSLSRQADEPRPLVGNYLPELPENDPGRGTLFIRAGYTDKGGKGLPALRSEDVVKLRSTNVGVQDYDRGEYITPKEFDGKDLVVADRSGAYIMLESVDLTNLAGVTVMVLAPKDRLGAGGGRVELHLDDPAGPLVGRSAMLAPTEGSSMQPNALNIEIECPTDGIKTPRDLYLVFLNEDVSSGSLMAVLGTQYRLSARNLSR